jgi:cytochrome b6-f complex iron-sulfur subunit
MALVGFQAMVAFLFYFWPRRTGSFGTRIGTGKPDDYVVGDVRYFVAGRFYLARLEEGFIALYQKCPHLGCAVPWKPAEERLHEGELLRGLFVCPCHGSTYLRNGQVIKGPAPRSLDYMPVRLEQGRLVVDTGRIVRRERWDPSQALRV